jgi:hypothetical protein
MLRKGRIMASLQDRNGSYRVLFCHHGKLHTFTIGKVGKDEAEAKARPRQTQTARFFGLQSY